MAAMLFTFQIFYVPPAGEAEPWGNTNNCTETSAAIAPPTIFKKSQRFSPPCHASLPFGTEGYEQANGDRIFSLTKKLQDLQGIVDPAGRIT